MQPIELRAIPYDINSVMHFGPRDFSKNGHRTILFKDPNVLQTRVGLTKADLRKIETVYGPECRARDRQEKLQLCQSYPGVARKKREVEPTDMSSRRPEVRKKRGAEEVTKSLRVNPEITPPPNAIKDTLAELGIDDAVQNVVEQVYKVSALALKNARDKYCNNTKPNLRSVDVKDRESTDVLGIIEVIAHYAQGMVGNAVANLTKFCEESETIEVYQRARCGWNDGSDRCRQTYRSTKSGAVKYSTQHRPIYHQSTNHRQLGHAKNIYDPMFRSSNNTDETTEASIAERKKREADDGNDMNEAKEGTDKNLGLENQQSNGDEQGKKNNQDSANLKEKVENREETPEIREEKTEKDGEEKLEEAAEKKDSLLRSGTKVPPLKVNRYEPMRRQARRSRVRHSKNEEEMDLSSVSIETERPRKHHRPADHRESDKADRERKHRETTMAEERWTINKMKRKDRKEREREDAVEEREEATERYKKRPRKEQRSEILPEIVKLSKENEEFYNDRKWPRGVVRYTIKEDTTYDTNDLRRRLEEVNSILKQKTCVRLKEITEDQAKNYDDYIVIDNSRDYVTGRVGGRQVIAYKDQEKEVIFFS